MEKINQSSVTPSFCGKGRVAGEQSGVIVVIVLLALVILLILGSYFLRSCTLESELSRKGVKALRAYYLAEAGVNEAIWKLKNDNAWKDNFISDCDWESGVFTRGNIFFPNSSYQIQAKNSYCAEGEIIATSTLYINQESQTEKTVKVRVSKDLVTLTKNSAIFSGGESQNITITASGVKIYRGNIFSNNILNIKSGSMVEVFDNPDTEELEGQVLATGNLIVEDSTLGDVEAKCAKNICTEKCDGYQVGISNCPPDLIEAPIVDFDSVDNPNSLKNQAQEKESAGECEVLCDGVQCSSECLFTESSFGELLWEVGLWGTLTLNNDITYVDGGIELTWGQQLMVNGVLAVKGTVDIWKGSPQLTIDEPNQACPSGLLAKDKINFGKLSAFSNLTATGTIYAEEEIRFEGMLNNFNIVGGIWAKKLTFDALSQGIDITLDNERISKVLNLSLSPGSPPPSAEYSSVITVEDWEEIY